MAKNKKVIVSQKGNFEYKMTKEMANAYLNARKGEEKKNLTIKDLLAMFEKAAGSEMNSDALLLS